MAEYKAGDPVISYSKHSYEQCGVVHKISEIGAHVKFWDVNLKRFFYEIFRHNKTHALHSGIEQIHHLHK